MRILTVAALRSELLFCPRPKQALGVGARAGVGLWRALARWHPAGVLVVGFSGAASPELAPGKLVLAALAGEVEIEGRLLDAAAAALPEAVLGRMAQVERPAGPPEKARLGIGAAAVDMESESVARELSRQGVPFLIVRCLLDALWEDVTAGPRIRWARRAIACARHLGQAARRLTPVWEVVADA